MIVSLVNNYKTISFITPGMVTKIADTKSKKSSQHMQFLYINKLDAV